ncbi:MAG: LacI family DNA-binding transcriptional regulator [Phycisphaeraceae bacterium]
MTTTLKHIAARAGVSHTTVASALHGTGRVSDAQRQRIQRLAGEMGYQPRTVARLLRAKRTGRVGIVVAQPDPVEAMSRAGSFTPLIAAIFKQCKQRCIPQHIDFCAAGRDDDGNDDAFTPPEHLAGGLVDGALVMGWLGPRFQSWLDTTARKPWVHLTEPAPRCVLSDDADAVRQAARHLAELGHRRVAFACGDLTYEVHRAGLKAFHDAARTFGFEADHDRWIHTMAGDLATLGREAVMDDVLAWALRALDAPRRPTAVLYHSGPSARAVVEAARRLNIDVPNQLSLAGYGSRTTAIQAYPRLTTVERDIDTLVTQALDMLQACIEDPAAPPRTEWVASRLVVRESTAPCPESR